VAIEFNCSHCGKLLTTSDERARAQAKCPACGDLITVPAPASSLAGGVPSAALAPTAAWSASSALDASGAGASETASPTGPQEVFHSLPGTAAAGGRGEFPFSQPRPVIGCPNCGTEAEVGALYCSTCGAPLSESGPRLRYAAFWRRVVAALIDLAILAVAETAMRFVLPGRTFLGENLWFVLWFLYHSLLESSREQATIGKRILGIIVCGSDGRRLTLPRAAIRTLAKILSAMICGIGYIMPLLTPQRQALHDILTDAVVVRK